MKPNLWWVIPVLFLSAACTKRLTQDCVLTQARKKETEAARKEFMMQCLYNASQGEGDNRFVVSRCEEAVTNAFCEIKVGVFQAGVGFTPCEDAVAPDLAAFCAANATPTR